MREFGRCVEIWSESCVPRFSCLEGFVVHVRNMLPRFFVLATVFFAFVLIYPPLPPSHFPFPFPFPSPLYIPYVFPTTRCTGQNEAAPSADKISEDIAIKSKELDDAFRDLRNQKDMQTVRFFSPSLSLSATRFLCQAHGQQVLDILRCS